MGPGFSIHPPPSPMDMGPGYPTLHCYWHLMVAIKTHMANGWYTSYCHFHQWLGRVSLLILSLKKIWKKYESKGLRCASMLYAWIFHCPLKTKKFLLTRESIFFRRVNTNTLTQWLWQLSLNSPALSISLHAILHNTFLQEVKEHWYSFP